MNIQWTNMTGFGPSAWNHGGAPVTILSRASQNDEKATKEPIPFSPDIQSLTKHEDSHEPQ